MGANGVAFAASVWHAAQRRVQGAEAESHLQDRLRQQVCVLSETLLSLSSSHPPPPPRPDSFPLTVSSVRFSQSHLCLFRPQDPGAGPGGPRRQREYSGPGAGQRHQPVPSPRGGDGQDQRAHQRGAGGQS